MASGVPYPGTLESKQMHAIPMAHMAAQMNLAGHAHPHSHNIAGPSHLVPSSASYLVPGDVDVGLEVSSSSGEALMPMFESITPLIADGVGGDENQQVESQLLELCGTVFNIQASMLQLTSAALLSPNVSARFHEAAMKRATQCRKQLSLANKKFLKIANTLADERKDLYDVSDPQHSSSSRMFASPAMHRAQAMQVPRQPNKRGRSRLVKCEKHRRWKKRCPPDCADKPSNIYGDVDDDGDDQDPEEEDVLDQVGMHNPMSLGNMNGMVRPPLHPPPPIQLTMPTHLTHHPHGHLVSHMPMMGGHMMMRPMMAGSK